MGPSLVTEPFTGVLCTQVCAVMYISLRTLKIFFEDVMRNSLVKSKQVLDNESNLPKTARQRQHA